MAQHAEALPPGRDTFSRDRVDRVLRSEKQAKIDFFQKPLGQPLLPEAYYQPADVSTKPRIQTLQQCLQDVDLHIENLDGQYGNLLKSDFPPIFGDRIARLVDDAVGLLTRLPSIPCDIGIDTSLFHLDDRFFVPGLSREWGDLKVVRFVDTNIIRLAIQYVVDDQERQRDPRSHPKAARNLMRTFLNDITIRLEEAFEETPDSAEVLVIRAFLWTSWQRAMLLYIAYLLQAQLRDGFPGYTSSQLGFRGQMIIKKYASKAAIATLPEEDVFTVPRHERGAMAGDFRTFYGVYSKTMAAKSYPARHSRVPRQSAHADCCPGTCERMYWSEDSYNVFKSNSAVSITHSDTVTLRYSHISANTMAISHVFAHGQGGRPEKPPTGTGFNQCLHQRYCEVAAGFGCDSYWMDTPCIPDDEDLRNEAIAKINLIFLQSKAVLVCDKDIMQVDVTDLDVSTQESILAILLASDWNKRAWTLLEGLKGRQSIHLLCKGGKTVSVKETLASVHSKGRIALSSLFLTMQHVLPVRQYSEAKHPQDDTHWNNVAEASSILARRKASRHKDEIAIWSLLVHNITNGKHKMDAENFWRWCSRRQNPDGARRYYVRTGYLISSIPRLAIRGFSWAPRQPTMPDEDHLPVRGELIYPDDGSRTAPVELHGPWLEAEWYISEFHTHMSSALVLTDEEFYESIDQARTAEDIHTSLAARFLSPEDTVAAILEPAGLDGTPAPYRTADGGSLFVLVASGAYNSPENISDLAMDGHVMPRGYGGRWTWRGIFKYRANPRHLGLLFQRETVVLL